jgi:hypothetical protein
MSGDREQKIRERAHVLWEAEGRPEGREHDHWREAERQVVAEEAGEGQPQAPDEAAVGSQGGPPADPLRNPEPIPPAEDLEYPAVTGPEEVPDIPGARASLNPTEIVEEPRSSSTAGAARPTRTAGKRKTGSAEVPLRKRPGNSTLEP